MTERYFLAVDGGATKTSLVIRTTDGQSVFEKTSTSSNYHAIGKEKVEKLFHSLLKEAYESTHIKNIDVAVFAIAGIDTKYDLDIVSNIVEKSCNISSFHFNKVIVENDVEVTLIGLTKGKPGALIISGTGAICFATDGNSTVRTGGWGHRAGDEGSGHWIGQQILRSIFQHEDGRKPQSTILKDLVYKKLNISNVDQLMNWLYRPSYTNAQVASVCSVLQEAVNHDDEVAKEIAKSAARELALLAITTVRKVLKNKNEPFTIFVNGGVLKNNVSILNLFKQLCLDEIPTLTFKICNQPPIDYIFERALYTKI